jgi:hypothetical protein
MTEAVLNAAHDGLVLAAAIFLAVLLTLLLDVPSRTDDEREREVEDPDGCGR